MELVKGTDILKEADTQSSKMISKDQRIIKSAALMLSAGTAAAIAPEPETILLVLIMTANMLIKYFSVAAKRFPEVYEFEREYFRQTQTYKECKEEYDKVIKEVASLIRRLGLNSSKEICIFIGELIHQGYLSATDENEFKRHIFDKEHYLPELAGAKVLTGGSVCRHYAPLTADILTELGYETCTIAVTQITSYIPLIEFLMRPRANHITVGVYEDDQKYTYDPTWECFGSLDETISDYNRQKNNILKIVKENSKSYAFIRKPNLIINRSKEELQFKMHSSPLATITLDESNALKEKIQRLMDQHEYEIAEFAADNRQSIRRISKLYQELFPSSDRPIKKWLIRK